MPGRESITRRREPRDAAAAPGGTATHCPYCALQCAMTLNPGAAGGAVTVGPRDFPVNRGRLCQKGWTAASLLTAPDRLTAPLIRAERGGPLIPADWDDALDVIAQQLSALRARHGADSVAVYGGGGLTNEKAYLLGKFARVALGTSQIDYNGRFCMSSAAAAGIRAFGADRGLPFPVTDLADAAVIMLAGANVAETMPPIVAHLRSAALVVIDPRLTATATLARQGSGLHLQPAPGTDCALALAMLHIAVTEGLADRRYIGSRTTGFTAAWRRAAHWWPERAERVTGVAVADMRTAVRMLARAAAAPGAGGPDAADGNATGAPGSGGSGGAYLLTGRGTEQHADGTDTVSAWINLALALGLPGTPGSGYGCLTGQGNGQGGREHGQKADQLPGYRSIEDPSARAHVARTWGVTPGELPGPGRSASELFASLGTPDGPRALLVFGSNPAVSAPDTSAVSARLASLNLLVVADFVLSETAAMADVVLPVTQWAEEDGTMTNLEGRVLRRRRAAAPPAGVRTDLQVLSDLAARLGQPPARFPADPQTVFTELRDASAGGPADYGAISYDRLDAGEELHWPCPAGEDPHPGTPRMFTDRFWRPDGRAAFIAVDYRGPAESPDAAYPLTATTGRLLAHYQSGAQTRRIAALRDAVPEACLEVHPDTAARHGLADGDLARVISRRGAAVARLRCDRGIRPDTVFLPFHFPGGHRANLVTAAVLDPVSRMPEFKAAAVRLEPVPAWPESADGAGGTLESGGTVTGGNAGGTALEGAR